MRSFSVLFLLFASFLANAQWSLEPKQSSLHFLSTKKTHITEIHSFKSFSGNIDKQRQLQLQIDLASVDTRIPIRDQRMQKELFKVGLYPKAVLRAQVPQSALDLTVGQSQTLSLPLELELHGVTQPLQAQVFITRISEQKVQANSLAPVLIDSRQFNLSQGIEVLQKLAGLDSISYIVPVTFNLIFEQ